MRMTTKFVNSINLYPVPDQIVEDENVLDESYNPLINLLLLMIDQDELEVMDLDIVTHPVEKRMKKWLDDQVAQLHEQGAKLTYGELEDEMESETNSGAAMRSLGEAPKSSPVTRSRERKDTSEQQPK